MDREEFSFIRRHLKKTQSEMAANLGISLRALQSFEQGWRNIPVHVERQVLYLLAVSGSTDLQRKPCWETKKCPPEWRENCPAFEYQSGQLCWFINGRRCRGKVQDTWAKKMQICRKCDVFGSTFPLLSKGLGDAS